MRWGGESLTALVLSSAWNNDVLLIDKINAFFLTFYVFGYCLRTVRVIRVSDFIYIFSRCCCCYLGGGSLVAL